MSGFKGNKQIELQPGDRDVSFGFSFTVCSSITANDGFLAHGTTASGVSVTAYKTADAYGRELSGGTSTVSDLIQGTPSVSNNIATVRMSYPSTNTFGHYKVTMLVTASDESVQEIDFNRILVKDK